MRIEFRRPSTGLAYFPGLARPIVIDTETLPPDEAREVARLVAEARLLDRPATAAPPPAEAADYSQYVYMIEDGNQRRMVQTTDFTEDPALQALARYLLRVGSAASARDARNESPPAKG